MNRKCDSDQLIQKLKEVSEHWSLQGLKNDVTPHVMGRLPDPVEAERQRCLHAGIAEESVNSTIDAAWQVAYQRYRSPKKQKSSSGTNNSVGSPSLFQQVEHLEFIGARLSGEAEVLHEIEDYFRQVEFYPIVRDQIKKILELVPSVFPENWQSPDGYDELLPEQQQAYREIARAGLQACPGPVIQKIIEQALEFKKQYAQ